MFESLPQTTEDFKTWKWEKIAPYYDDLIARPLTAENIEQWLLDWTKIASLIDEVNNRFTVATTTNTADTVAEEQYNFFLDEVLPPATAAEQRVKQKLLDSGLEPEGFAIPLRNLRGEAAIYRDSNLEYLADLKKQIMEYDQISGSQTVNWEGKEIPLIRLQPVLEDQDRDRREHAWRLRYGRIVQDEPKYAELWKRMINTRHEIARNAGFDTYREYRWQQMHRFDYTPEDAKRFNESIAQVVVPVVSRQSEKRRQQLGVPTLRHWDMFVDPLGQPPLRPWQTIDELVDGAIRIFTQLDPELGQNFASMRTNKQLDLEARNNKAPGGYELEFNATHEPFIYMNAVGTHNDVTTLLHEGGHAFQTFEGLALPYLPQRQEQMTPMEFAEVASMSMELLSLPYLTKDRGGFYSEADANRARYEQLRGMLGFWPYMAMIDALQHWVYENAKEAADLRACDKYWAGLVDRYWPHLDWTGLETEKRAFWHRQSHVFQDPFYYIEYGIAQLGAIQVWANAQRDQAAAVVAYRRALALGATGTLPELFAAANIKFAFDTETLRTIVDSLAQRMDELEATASV